MKRKKPLVITLVILLVLAAVGTAAWFLWLKDMVAASKANPVFVNSVASITGMTTGSAPRFAGVVEPQKTVKVNKDETKTLAEVYVVTGQEVTVGTPLFRYNTEEMQLQLTQAELELEGIENQITLLKKQLGDLEDEKEKADEDEQYAYTVKIQQNELDTKTQEYNSSTKKSEIDKLKKSLENADVLSEIDGVIKEINITPKTDSTGQPAPFISILSTGDYRIKGTVTELNIQSLSQGQPVVVHSRVDAQQTWTGTIDTIDFENTVSDNSGMMYGGMGDSGATKSSKYNFYVVLSSLDGLILGQHVYIEPGTGEEEDKKDGLYLPAFYLVHEEEGTYVWVADKQQKLEKRKVYLGEYDSDSDLYEILEGLTPQDFIATPDPSLLPGTATTQDASGMMPEGALDSGSSQAGGEIAPDAGGEAPIPNGDEAQPAPDGGGAIIGGGDNVTGGVIVLSDSSSGGNPGGSL